MPISPMGAKVSKRTGSKREAKALISHSNNDCCSSEGSSIVEAIKPAGCMKKRKTKKSQKGPLQSPEKRITKVSKLTLEDWLLASPAPGTEALHPHSLSGGELYVFKHLSRRVSSIRAREAVMSTQTDSFCVDKSVDIPSSLCSSFSRSQSGKPEKKVRFRLPEEADIVIFYSPAEANASSDQPSF